MKQRQFDLICVGSGALTIIFDDRSLEVRTPKPEFFFRGRNFADCEGTDFWETTPEEETYLKEKTKFQELGHMDKLGRAHYES